MKKTIKRIIITCVVLAFLFIASFVATDMILDRDNKGNDNNKVTTSDVNKEKALDNNIKISLFTADNKDKELSLKQAKEELGLEGEITEEVLSNALEKDGYELENTLNGELSYSRSAEDTLKPNKYYISEFNGFLAIYKCNESGKLVIENQDEDVFRNKKMLSDLPATDQQLIKEYKRVFDTKDDAVDGLYELVS